MKFEKIDTTAYYGSTDKNESLAGYLQVNSLGILFYNLIINADESAI